MIAQRALALVLLPLYTRYLSPEEFGLLSVAVAIGLAVSFLLSFGLESAVIHHWFKLGDRPREQTNWVASVATFMLGAPIAASALLVATILVVPGTAFDLGDGEMVLAIVGGTIWAMLNVMPFALLRAQERLRDYLKLTAVFALTNTLATVLLVVALDEGVAGWLLGTLIANLVTLAASFSVLPWPAPAARSLRSTALFGALAFSLPLVPHLMSQWALQLFDRLILEGLVSLSDLGIYSLAATLTAPIMIIANGLAQGSMPTYARAQTAIPRASAAVSDVIVKQVAAFSLIGLAGALLLPTLIELLLPPGYREAASLCPLLALSFTVASFYFIPMNLISMTLGSTRWAWVATLAGGSTNVAMLYILVPSGGIDMAPIAALAGYATLLISVASYAAYSARGRISLRLPLHRMILIPAALAVVYFVAASFEAEHDLTTLFIRLAAVMLAAGATIRTLLRQRSQNHVLG